MRIIIAAAIVAMSALSAVAQQPDRKDYMLSALQVQRNAAMDQEAVCRGETGFAMEALRREAAVLSKQVEDLRKELAEAKGAQSPKE